MKQHLFCNDFLFITYLLRELKKRGKKTYVDYAQLFASRLVQLLLGLLSILLYFLQRYGHLLRKS